MQAMESAFDVCTEDLFNQTVKLEEMEKKAGNAEGEVSSLRSRLILLQENNEKQEERLAKATLELAGACQRADSNVRKRTELENAVSSNEETIDNLDKQLSESKITLTDSENKFEDISRKLATLEADAARGNERAEGAEKKDQRHRGGAEGGGSQHAAAGDRGGEDDREGGSLPERDPRAAVQVEEERVQGRAGGDEHSEVERQDRPGGGGPLGGEVQD